ncbi:hypothetical Protein YC6258_00953 [Gynuella sunshinyii YC6258]|uniref:Uncharacterized protein n=1 Tax=Gynuella sunshinyii YC6258 TaxID=1445510 RepID=A0A0C5VI03_9GAMM|nr:hypothetical Protein YC6258_00953 [Gynuella sunshinyii YC6258]
MNNNANDMVLVIKKTIGPVLCQVLTESSVYEPGWSLD